MGHKQNNPPIHPFVYWFIHCRARETEKCTLQNKSHSFHFWAVSLQRPSSSSSAAAAEAVYRHSTTDQPSNEASILSTRRKTRQFQTNRLCVTQLAMETEIPSTLIKDIIYADPSREYLHLENGADDAGIPMGHILLSFNSHQKKRKI